jgi:hypothetical protein
MTRTFFLLLLLLAGGSGRAPAQSSPEDAAKAFSGTLKAGDWPGAARLMHPQALKQLRALFEPFMATTGMEQLGAQLFGLHSNAEFASTPDTVLFAAFLRAMLTKDPDLAKAMRTAEVSPLGHVDAGTDTVLVVSRMVLTVSGVSITQFDVMPFSLDQGKWRGLLKADFTNMAALFQKVAGTRRS